MGDYLIVRLEGNEEIRNRVNAHLVQEWGSVCIAVHREQFDLSDGCGFVCLEGETVLGAIHYRHIKEECEVLSLYVRREHEGIGQAMMRCVAEAARVRGANRLYLITTNDNTRAIRFYQQFGMNLEALDEDAVERARKLKPGIPLTGCDGIPIRHELRFGMAL